MAAMNCIPPPEEMRMSGDWSSNWESFRAEFEDYSLATGLNEKSAAVQAATLRRVMGSECRHVYKHNVNLTAEQQENVTAILQALEAYFKPAKNIIYERYVFGCCKQEEGESFDNFVTRLREKAATCEYGALKDELIRDKIVLGIASESARRRLLREHDLTLNIAIETCRTAELTDRRLKVMEQDRQRTDSINIAMQRYNISKPQQRRLISANAANLTACKYCGTVHQRIKEQCPAYGKSCRSCGRTNHFANVCLSSRRQPSIGKLHTVENASAYEEETVSAEVLYSSEVIGAVQSRGKKWFVTLRLNNRPQSCQLDSGATCDVMCLKDKMMLAPDAHLLPSDTKLKLYSGELMKSLGLFRTECVLRGQRHKLEFEIVEARQKPLLSGSTCERLGLIHFSVPAELNVIDNQSKGPLTKHRLLQEFSDVFTGPVESVPGEVHFDLDLSVPPVQCAPRNVPVALKQAVKAQLDQYEADGHLAPVTDPTDWISNMVIVKKPDKLRICIDPKFLNLALRRSHYIMPTLEDVLYKLPKARLFTLVDARDAFLQCKLDTASSYMTTFWTPWGRKRWLKLPFGVSVAPEVYQRKQHELLTGLSGVEPIADDILVVGCGDTDEEAEQDHDGKLLELMDRCRQVKLRLGIKKLQFKVKEVRFHGHILSWEGLKADPDKLRAILDMPQPENVKSLQRFIGFVTYLAKFLPHLSEVCEPLRRLLDKDAVWHWLPKHDNAVQDIKRLVTDTPVLKYYDITTPVTIQSDASKTGLGCCLLQAGQPIAFASRALTLTEQNYAQIEKECLSIVFACQRFHHYLYGRDEITAETDHKPLISIFKKPLLCAPKRLQSMLLTLQNYCLNVVYKPGPEMYISDTLSRATAAGGAPDYAQHTVCNVQQDLDVLSQINHSDYLNVTDQRLLQIKQHTETDESLQALKYVVLDGWPDSKEEVPLTAREYWTFRDEIGIQDGILYKGQRVIIPKSLRSEMLTRIHASHIGGEACYRQARDTLYWPNMQNEIKDFVSHCSACNEYAQAQQKEPMMSHVLPTRPWQIVSMDLLNYAGQDFLLIVDHYSDFWEIELLPDLSADTTIRRCKVQFARYGQPDRVISDNGPQFACEQFRRFSADWGFEHVTSSPRHPQANGKAESAVKIVKNICKKAKYDGTDPWKAVLHWRNTPSEGMDSSPAQRLMSRRLKTLLPVANKLLEPCVVTGVLEKLRRRKQIAKLSYDVSAKDLPELSIGEPIRMKPLPGDRTGRWRLGSCVQRVAPRSYLVDVDGSLYRRNRVALRRAERLPIQAYVPPARAPPEVLNAPGPHPQSGGNTAVLSEGYIEN
uniref:Gypsy retrotransposon integrase-like protein 1 n=1 Tax=Leptobrachium leishanense TaxID=445787 RepID=A0A8C5Q7G7_9ANUR